MPPDNRRSSRTLLSYDDALARLLAHAPQLQASDVGLGDAAGRVLREPVLADRDQPPFNRSAMDGFAMNAAAINAAMQADPSGALPIIGDVPAGAAPPTIHTNTEASPGVVRIATGAMLPDGYDAVVQIELSEVSESSTGPASVRFALDTITPWQNVHRRAADASRGDTLIAAGARLSPHHLGIAASAGAVKLAASDRPRVVVLSTGDEVLPPDTATEALLPHQIRNSNGPMLIALLTAMGAEVVEHRHLPDEAEHVRAAAREALGRAHLVITAGGVSVGQRDLLPWAWQQLGCHTLIHGVAIQPGKPLFVASPIDPSQPATPGEVSNKLVIGLPGNPVSVLATAHLFVWPLLRHMLAGEATAPTSPWHRVRLAAPIKPRLGRQLFRAARIREDGRAEIIHWHGSGDLAHTSHGEGWVRLPMQEQELAADSEVNFLPLVGG